MWQTSESEALECLEEREPDARRFYRKNLDHDGREIVFKWCTRPKLCRVAMNMCWGWSLISLEASRIANYELWKDAADGEHLEKITAQNEHVTARMAEPEGGEAACDEEV